MSIGDRPPDWETTARDWQRHAEQLRDQRNAAREEIARLREALEEVILWFHGGGPGFNSASWLVKARAALACRPQGEKS